MDREIWSSLHGRFPWEHGSYLLVTLKCYNGTSKCFQEQGKIAGVHGKFILIHGKQRISNPCRQGQIKFGIFGTFRPEVVFIV